MERRTAESPMDFEWQTRAPGDITSPFYQLGLQHNPQKKGDYSVFDSPIKKQQPLTTTKQFTFAQTPSSQRPGSPSRSNAIFGKPSFQTPRKFDSDFSSGPENNMSSPENADNEDTPEPVTKKEKRNSLFNLYGRFAPSPGRGEIPRLARTTNDQARRVHKRRIRDRDINRHLRMDSDYDSDRPSSREEKRSRKEDKQAAVSATAATANPAVIQGSSWASFFSFLDEHPNLPTILSYWLQLVWNLIIFTMVTSVVVSFVWSIKNDIDHAADVKRNEILAEIFACKELYDKNRCGADERPPALNEVCNNWERCMDQDPTRVARATVSVQTISAIVTGFVDAISLKAFSFFLLTIATLTIASNWSFIAFRNQCTRKDDHYPYPHPSSQPPPPPTPYHHHQQHPPLSFPDGNQYSLQYPKTPGRGDNHSNSSPIHQRSFEVTKQDDDRFLLEDSPSRNMDFVTGRSREREQHLHTPSPSKRYS